MLVVDPRFPLTMRLQAPTNRGSVGAGAFQARRKNQRPFHEFEYTLKLQFRAEAERFAGFAAYHQGDTPFWFDGAHYSDIQEPIFIGYGDGVTTNFFAPRRNLFAPSWVVYVNGIVAAVTIVESSGLIIFAVAPPLNSIITGKGRNRFKVLFMYDDEFLQTMNLILGGIHETGAVRFLEVA